MAYPTSLDSFTNPTANQTLNSPSHSTIETAQNTALSALETKVGITGSAVTSTVDYKLTNTASVSPGHKHVTADITDAGTYISTGFILPYTGTGAPTGFLLCDGSAVSRTTYATLFGVTSTNFGAGDGATTFNVPDLRSRFIVGAGTAGTKVYTFASRASNIITATGMANSATNENQTGQIVTYHTSGSVMTGLTNDTNYYLIRQTYNTFNLASTLANAQNGTAISLSSDGSGTQTFTFTLLAHTLANTGGEETHAMSSTELLAHTHAQIPSQGTGGGTFIGNTSVSGTATSSTGGNAAMNISPSYLALTYVIKT